MGTDADYLPIDEGSITGHGLNVEVTDGKYRCRRALRSAYGAGDGDNMVWRAGPAFHEFSFVGAATGAVADPSASAVSVTITLSTGKTIAGSAFIEILDHDLPFAHPNKHDGKVWVMGTGRFTGTVTYA